MDDRTAILELCHRQALAMDVRDWGAYRATFTDDLDVDFSSLSGQPAQAMRAVEWTAAAATLFDGFDATQHLLANPIVEDDGDVARVSLEVRAEHQIDDDWFAYGGHYRIETARTQDGWRIRRLVLTVRWRRGDARLLRRAAERGAASHAQALGNAATEAVATAAPHTTMLPRTR